MRALLLVLCSAALFGCELVADFDRSKLVQPQPDAGNTAGGGGGVPDGGQPDAVIPMPDEDAGDDDAG